MIWIIIGAIAIFIFGYLVGANNPLSSVKAEIIKEAQAGLTGASNAIKKV